MWGQERIAGFALALAATASLICAPATGAKPVVDSAAPPFVIKLFDKSQVTLADLRGQVVVINLWATWCGPCKAEMPMMDAAFTTLEKRGLRIFGVVTRDSLPPSQLRKLDAVLHYPLASEIKGPYGVINNGVPSNYIIDRKGVVRYARAGSFSAAQFVDLVLPLLDEPAS